MSEMNDDFEENQEREDQYKTISIRGVKAETYEQFSKKIQMMEMNLGEAVTKLMEDVVNTFEDEFPDLSAKSLKLGALGKLSISHHNDLVITKTDLEEAERAVVFEHCNGLEFTKDVDKDTFLNHVKYIAHSKNVRIPRVTSKLLLLSKVQFCKNVEFYDLE